MTLILSYKMLHESNSSYWHIITKEDYTFLLHNKKIDFN